jgi:hypothetical protein
LLAFSTSALAKDQASPQGFIVPQAGFFVGLGASYNWAGVDQDLKGIGISDIFIRSRLVASGNAGGPQADFDRSADAFALDAQAGYFRRFTDSPWLGGVKFAYNHLDLTSSEKETIPQTGSFTLAFGRHTTIPFTGHVAIPSSRVSIDDEMALMPFIGRAIGNSYFYVGGGPALFRTVTKFAGGIGFADINGTELDVTGTPISFSSSDWVWGGAGQVGMNYFLSRSWALDLNYTFAMSAHYKIKYAGEFTSSNGPLTTVGTAYFNDSQQVTTQAFSVSINRVF